jgi:2-polyprenyl-6-methoxyphenol hydroxylase-like FAD-dependent oxidoreductase
MVNLRLIILVTACVLTSGDAFNALSSSLISNKDVCIVGAGPVGLYFASLLLQQDPTVRVKILEKAPRQGKTINAFGIGLGQRLLRCLDDVPGLKDRVASVGARVNSIDLLIASRVDICNQMVSFLQETYNDGRCTIDFEEGCRDVSFGERIITTTKNRQLKYDLLIAADGINSLIRRKLVDEKGLKEEHYVDTSNWKALRLPPQTDLEAGSFKPVSHPAFRGGRVIPRYPEGHILLMFWKSGVDNPGGATNAEQLKDIITASLQDKKQKFEFFRTSLGIVRDNEIMRERKLIYDEQALEEFLVTRPFRSHYMKLDRYHEDSVALLGDAAHGMGTLLGQGCACGLESARTLSKCLLVDSTSGTSTDINSALEEYSKMAIPEAHAITDLNLVGAILRGGPFAKLLALPLSLWQALRGKMLFKRVGDNVPCQTILKENRLMAALAKSLWKKDWIPHEPGSKEGG